VQWDEGPVAEQSSAGYAQTAADLAPKDPQKSLHTDGDFKGAIAGAAHVLELPISIRSSRIRPSSR